MWTECKECGEPLQVRMRPRGSPQVWCGSACRQRWARDERALVIGRALQKGAREEERAAAFELVRDSYDRAERTRELARQRRGSVEEQVE